MKAYEQSKLYPNKTTESHICGCYHCFSIFKPEDINEWVDDVNEDRIPLCPYCHQDAVIGDACGYIITEDLLKEMNEYSYSEE